MNPKAVIPDSLENELENTRVTLEDAVGNAEHHSREARRHRRENELLWRRNQKLTQRVAGLAAKQEVEKVELRALKEANRELSREQGRLQRAQKEAFAKEEQIATYAEELNVLNEELTTSNEQLEERSRELEQIRWYLERSQHRLQVFVDSMVDAFFLVEQSGRIYDANPAAYRLFDLQTEEIIGRKIETMLRPANRTLRRVIPRPPATELDDRDGISKEGTGIRKNEGSFPAEYIVSPLTREDRRTYGVTVWDITARKEADAYRHHLESELYKMARIRDLGALASATAHELNQPLGAVTNYVETARHLLESADQSEVGEAAGLLKLAADEAIRTSATLESLRRLVNSGPLMQSNEDINDTVREAVGVLRASLERYGVTVTYRMAHGLPDVKVDRIQIQQVMLNLVRNAIEAMVEAKPMEIHVSTRQLADDTIKVTVRDTGSGIQREVVDTLFHPLVTTKGDGMGIGLSICHSIIESHGGKVWATRPRGGGATFNFTVPRA